MNSIRTFLIVALMPVLTTRAQNSTPQFVESEIAVELSELTIHGTLTIPTISNKPPVVLIIAGSGATDRDGNNVLGGLNCNAYKQLAHALAVNNIASLRYDKRGVGKSKVTTQTNSPRIFGPEVKDAKDLVGYLRKDGRFSKIIIAAHSQGALVGMLASENVDKFISLSGVGSPGAETLREQLKDQPPLVGELSNPIIDSLQRGFTVNSVPQFLEPLFKKSAQPYLISWFRYDPAVELSKLKIPILIIQGDHDVQIKVEDARRMKSLTPDARLVIISKMNHIFKLAPLDRIENIKTYSDPSLPIENELVQEVVNFILK